MEEFNKDNVIKLGEDELKDVTGGRIHYERELSKLTFYYRIGDRVECYYHDEIIYLLPAVRSHGGIVTQVYYAGSESIGWCDCYYIQMDDAEYSGWYPKELIENYDTPASQDYKGGYFHQ